MSDSGASSAKTAVVTGASAGIGAATARRLSQAGFHVVMGARRTERLQQLAAELPSADYHALDVADPQSVAEFVARLDRVDLLVNNAGLSLGLDPVLESSDEPWETMFQINVMGVLRMTRALLPKLIASGDGHLIQLGSISGFEVYPGGSGYTASKHALRAMTRTLRLELFGKPVRVTEIAPGLVETEFSIVRFDGDQERADKVYAGMEPLNADDIADCIVWAATRPPHVNIDEIVIKPRDQATATMVHRKE